MCNNKPNNFPDLNVQFEFLYDYWWQFFMQVSPAYTLPTAWSSYVQCTRIELDTQFAVSCRLNFLLGLIFFNKNPKFDSQLRVLIFCFNEIQVREKKTGQKWLIPHSYFPKIYIYKQTYMLLYLWGVEIGLKWIIIGLNNIHL